MINCIKGCATKATINYIKVCITKILLSIVPCAVQQRATINSTKGCVPKGQDLRINGCATKGIDQLYQRLQIERLRSIVSMATINVSKDVQKRL